MDELDDIIPPPSEFADTPITNVINNYVIETEGTPEPNPLHYIMEEQNNILNYLNHFQTIKYQIELKVIFENINDEELTTDSYRTIKISSNQLTKLGFNMVTEEDLFNAIESFPQQLDSDVLRLIGSGCRIHLFKNIKINIASINVLLAASYVPLPFDCRSVVNVKNEYDNNCRQPFPWPALMRTAQEQGKAARCQGLDPRACLRQRSGDDDPHGSA